MSDRLEEIKQQSERVPGSDLDWLIGEVELLRWELEITERANLANGQMVARMAGYVPTADQRQLLADERRRRI